MEAQRLLRVLVVHPVLATARWYAERLLELGIPAEPCDELALDYDEDPVSALVLCGSLHWWIDEDRALPPTVLVGGDAVGLVRAAGATRCPEGSSPDMVACSLRALLRLASHSRGRGTMPIRLVTSTCIVKVGRWMTVQRSTFDEDHQLPACDLRPTVH